MIIGSHVRFNNEQLLGSTKEAINYNANTFMFYTGAPQNTIRKDIDINLTNKAKTLMKEHNININNVIAHAPYIINLANKNNLDKWNFSCAFLKEELRRIDALGVSFVVVHPGNSLDIEKDIALNNISEALNLILDNETNCMVLLETMAGKGSECGKDLEELLIIYNGIINKDRVGICLDTCHLNDSGVDLTKFNNYLDLFDTLIGIDKIKCIHINDSKNILGSKKDRHENIGYGTIGFDNIINIIYNDRLLNIPKILETPYINGLPPYKEEINIIRNKKFIDYKNKYY